MHNDILKFAEFLDFYKEKYAKPSYEISKPKPDDSGFFDEKNLIPLVSSDFHMLDFDSMCDDANFYPKRPEAEKNQPSTVDALYYRIKENNKLEFYLVEFKSFYFDWYSSKDYNSSVDKVISHLSFFYLDDQLTTGLNRLNSIKKIYGNTIEFSLRLKPYESLFVVLPKIYEEYCAEKNIDVNNRIDLFDFYRSDFCEIKLIVVGKNSYDPTKDYLGALGGILNKQYKRLDFVNILIPHKFRLCFKKDFDKIAKYLKNDEFNNIKSLNYTGDL